LVEIIGIYAVNENPDVSLVEVIVEKSYDEFNISDFTQAVEGLKRGSLQAPFGDTYLNTIGTQVIGDYFRKPLTKLGITRLAFLFIIWILVNHCRLLSEK